MRGDHFTAVGHFDFVRRLPSGVIPGPAQFYHCAGLVVSGTVPSCW
jgi:hypothetical protein